MLTISHLSAGYQDLPILKDISLELQSSAISVLMGPNGAGKTTLLKSIFQLADVTGGQIFFAGRDITRRAAHELLELGIAFVPQGRVNFGLLSVKDNLLLGTHHLKDKTKVAARLAGVENLFPILHDQTKQLAFRLSGGQQQILAIGRALMSSPKFILMDEPTLGLAPKLVKEIFQHIRAIRENFGTTILIVEHNLKSLMDIADYGYVMVQGEIVAHDTCVNLKNSEIMKQVFVGKME